MRNDELIIDGVAVDLGTTNVSLEYVNNIISSIDKINASHSYTLSLPRTVKNERVFDFAGDVSHVSDKVGVYLEASYRRRGITIVKDAKCYVSGVTESAFEVCLLWDGLARFTEWKKESPSLNEIVFSSYIWDGVHTSYFDYYDDVVQAVYNTGVDESILPATPCVNAFGLLSKVMENIVDTWRIPNAKKNELLQMFIPLCKRGGTRSESMGGVWNGIGIRGGGFVSLQKKSFGSLEYSDSVDGVSLEGKSALDISFNYTTSEAFTGSTLPTLKAYGHSSTNDVVLHTTTPTRDALGRLVYADSYSLDNLSNYSSVYFKVIISDIGRGVFSIIPTMKVAVLNDFYDVGANLPSISQLDYIKAVCALFGCQIVNNSDGTLSFVSVDDVYARKGEALNWTSKIVNYRQTPAKVSFTLGEYAQRNWFRYKEDNGRQSEAFFDIANVSLASEKDVVTLPFAVTKDDEVFQYTEKDGVVSDVNVTPRILRGYETEDGDLGVRWEQSLNFDAILAKYYGGLRSLLEYAVQIKAYARLDERDLATLEWTRPIYLSQTGKYYIVAKVATDASSDISELTLYQL